MNIKHLISIALFLALSAGTMTAQSQLPWSHGKLQVSGEHRYLKHEDGTPFFWMGDTGWLLPERLTREEASFYLGHCQRAGYNMVQVQTINDVPAMNAYGQYSHPDGFNFKDIDRKGVYGYWDHIDYIVRTAGTKGIYIGMVCIWGGLVKRGDMDVKQAQAYGKFLAERYKDSPNIVWIIGGDVRGDVKPEVWTALATTIRGIDPGHLMTFHPFGRTASATWFNDAPWLDFNMFQSGHRRYGQQKGDGSDSSVKNIEEDNWRFADYSLAQSPLKPVLDAEPIYEEIPQGLHDPSQPRWTAADVRRYAYWSVFAGSCGHTYGHNSIMQFYRPGTSPAYGAYTPWYDALKAPGFNQMKFLKNLLLTFPYFERVPDQGVIAGTNGERYDRAMATRGADYLLVYNYSGAPINVDLSKIGGVRKNVWWYNPADGQLAYAGEFDSKVTTFQPDVAYASGNDRVLIAVDATKNYVAKEWSELPDAQAKFKTNRNTVKN